MNERTGMRAAWPKSQQPDSLIATYAEKMAQAMVVRRAALEAQSARIEADLSIKARSKFLANMNHELRTPLNAIIGFASMLKESAEYSLDEEKRVEYASYILQSADLLLGHINTILETADLDGGDVKIRHAETNLADVLHGSVNRTKIAADAAGVSIEIKGDQSELRAWADEERVGQAVDHLLRVALKSSEHGERILVRVAEDDRGWAEIAVRDNGAGFNSEEIHAALNAFSEDHRGLDRSFDGPGIELAVAKTLIEMQGGRFSIKSKPGKGTLVRIAAPPKPALENHEPEDVRLAG